MMKKYLPLFHNHHGKHCLIVGGGTVAMRRYLTLTEHGIKVDVISKDILPSLQDLLKQNGSHYTLEKYHESALRDFDMIIAATDDKSVNATIALHCKQKRIPVNVVSDPDLCDFIFPAVVERLPLQIAIAGGGASPILSRLLKNMVHGLIPPSYGKLASLVSDYRKDAKNKISDEKKRVAFWEAILQGPVAEAMFSGKEADAHALLKQALDDPEKTIGAGEVYLIGAGPGDPSLLTLRAFRLIQQADVILYDRLISEEIMALTRPDAEKVYVGKKRAFHSVPQDEINQLLIRYAQQGKRVARLKGGDPFIFGRGGEEIEQLAAQQIPFQVIPGITAASGCAAYSGIPLTHRDHAQSVRFVTGNLKDGTVNLPWRELVAPSQTIVFYMGLNSLDIICKELIKHGAEPHLPAALIAQGTLADQRVITATLTSLTEKVAQHDIHSPTLLIIGTVVSLHSILSWFNKDQTL